MKKIFVLLFLLNFELILSQTFIHPTLPSDEITGIHYLNDMDVIFINSGGSIYKSYNGGITWQLKKYYPHSNLAEIQFIDEKTGFIRTNNYYPVDNMLIYTGDGGETWGEADVSIYPAYSFLPLSQSVLLKAAIGSIERLDNFYNDWQTTFKIPTYVDSSSDLVSREYYGIVSKLLRLNNGNILALGNNLNAFYKGILHDSVSYILESRDQGLTWDTLWMGLKQAASDFIFVNDSTGWMLAPDSVYNSLDGGLTWTSRDTKKGSEYKSLFAEGNNIYLLDSYNMIEKSTDNGINWTVSNSDNFYFTSGIFNDPNNGFLFGEALERTSNGGKNWINLTPHVRNNIIRIQESRL